MNVSKGFYKFNISSYLHYKRCLTISIVVVIFSLIGFYLGYIVNGIYAYNASTTSNNQKSNLSTKDNIFFIKNNSIYSLNYSTKAISSITKIDLGELKNIFIIDENNIGYTINKIDRSYVYKYNLQSSSSSLLFEANNAEYIDSIKSINTYSIIFLTNDSKNTKLYEFENGSIYFIKFYNKTNNYDISVSENKKYFSIWDKTYNILSIYSNNSLLTEINFASFPVWQDNSVFYKSTTNKAIFSFDLNTKNIKKILEGDLYFLDFKNDNVLFYDGLKNIGIYNTKTFVKKDLVSGFINAKWLDDANFISYDINYSQNGKFIYNIKTNNIYFLNEYGVFDEYPIYF